MEVQSFFCVFLLRKTKEAGFYVINMTEREKRDIVCMLGNICTIIQ